MQPHKYRKCKRSKFIRIEMQIKFILTLQAKELNQLITRAITEGIGDWGIIDKATKVKGRAKGNEKDMYTVPFHVIDISTNQSYTITRSKLLRGIRDGLIDFPYALDTQAGYNLKVNTLTREDIDEIMQLSIFKKMQYGFI